MVKHESVIDFLKHETVSKLSRKTEVSRDAIYRLFRKDTFNIGTLERIAREYGKEVEIRIVDRKAA